MKKWLILSLVLFSAMGAGMLFFLQRDTKPTAAITPSATVERGTLEARVSGSGSVSSITNEDVMADEGETVYELHIKENDSVEKDQKLWTYTDGTTVTAPAAGTITMLDVEEGDRASLEKPAAHLTNYSALQTVIQVDELDINKIKENQEAEVTASAFPGRLFKGKVTEIKREGTVENGVSTFDVTIRISDPQQLKIGMTAEASIVTESKEDILYAPVEAIRKNGDEAHVLVISNGSSQAKPVRVKTGLATDTFVEITEGVDEGQQVQLPVVSPSQNGANVQMGPGMGVPFSGGGMGGPMKVPLERN